MRRVLLLDPTETRRREMLVGLRTRGIDAEAVEDIAGGASVLASGRTDLVLVAPSGVPVGDVLAATRAAPFPVDIVALIEGDSIEGLHALREGAADFVSMSEGIDGVALALRKVEARRTRGGAAATGDHAPSGAARNGTSRIGSAEAAAVAGSAAGAASLASSPAPSVMVGHSPKIAAVLTMVKRLAGVRAAVLVGGESGTGKELVARALHDQSPWRTGPFVAVNCGAIPSGLIESELFGHVRGSFTDAFRDKPGLFETAHGGTLFLDEIADLPLGLQSKLLRAVQDFVIRRVGDVEDMLVEVRVVAATARDLPAEIRAGRFREDLFYRLAGLQISLPPLRDRPDDIPLLAHHFLARARARLSIGVREIEAEAMRLLTLHPWPGNVRELENTIERAAVMCSGDRIDVESLPERVVGTAPVAARDPGATAQAGLPAAADVPDLSIKRASRRSEEELIRRALTATGGNRTRAAELLEISHRALLYKIKEYRIKVSKSDGKNGSKTDGRNGSKGKDVGRDHGREGARDAPPKGANIS